MKVQVSDRLIHQACRVLSQGGLVALPTETLYGLAVDPLNEDALNKLFLLKKRPRTKPVLTLIASMGQLNLLVSEIPRPYHKLMAEFWPGPLTLIFPARAHLPSLLTGSTATVGVRMSSAPVVRRLIRTLNRPITGTSGNRSGEPAALSGHEIRAQFVDGIDLVIDATLAPGSRGSTIVAYRNDRLVCIREGDIGWAAIRAVAG